jgi:phosphoribosylformylglycinamidine cyclo-ligase
MAKETTYEDAGVHNDAKEDVSKILFNAAKTTWDNRKGKLGEVISAFDDFSGVRAIDVSNLPKGTLMNIGFDGVGTKMELAERLNDHTTIAYDLFAMVCDDAVVRGAEPVLVGSILDTNSLKGKNGPFVQQVRQLAQGYVDAAKSANVAVVNGECAELGSRVGGYGEFNYNWGAAVVWFANRERMFTGREIKPRDSLVGLREEGFRSNGLSLVRRIMKEKFGDDWHLRPFGDTNYGYAVLKPSQIYTAAVVDMFGGYDMNREPKAEIHGVAHITGGGIPGKLGRMLKPSELSANIGFPMSPSSIMQEVKQLGNVSDYEAYKTWNMGTGMIIATPDPKKVMEVAREYGIDSGIIGEVTKQTKPEIKIGELDFLIE